MVAKEFYNNDEFRLIKRVKELLEKLVKENANEKAAMIKKEIDQTLHEANNQVTAQ